MGSKGSQTTTSSTESRPDKAAYALYSELLDRARGVANTPYTPYTGELVAPVNAQQNMGIAGINAGAGYAQPYMTGALDLAQSAAQPLTAEQIMRYQSPYTQSVVDATARQFADMNATQQQGVVGNAITQGAWGGNRVGVAQAELARQQRLAQDPVIAGLYNQSYAQALQTAQQQQQNQAAGAYNIGALGVAGQNAALTGAGAQIGAGTLQQQTQQMQDAAKYQQFMQQQAYPFQTTQWLAGLGTGVGSQMGGTSSGSTTQPGPSMLGSIFGGLAGGAGILGQSGAFGAAGWLTPALAALKHGGRVPGYADGGVAAGQEEIPDTVPETEETLSAQQQQLLAGHRRAQMFPKGTPELELPNGYERAETANGAFHFDPKRLTPADIKRLSALDRENELLDLGPYSKPDILKRVQAGEMPVAVVERTPEGVEVRAAAGTHSTASRQLAEMNRTKSPGNVVSIEDLNSVVSARKAPRRAAGGGVAGMPFADVTGFIPNIDLVRGPGAPRAAAPQAHQEPKSDLAGQMKGVSGLAGSIANGLRSNQFGDPMFGAGVSAYEGAGASAGLDNPTMYARGGGVAGYAEGGVPTFDERFYGEPEDPPRQPSRPVSFDERFAGEEPPPRPASGVVGSTFVDRYMPAMSAGVSPLTEPTRSDVPLPLERPAEADAGVAVASTDAPAVDAGEVTTLPSTTGVVPRERPITGAEAVPARTPTRATPTAGFMDNIERYGAAIRKMESSGNYRAVGPETVRKNGFVDRPLGAYGIMESNLPEWSRQVLGREMSREEFLGSPAAQDALFRAKFGSYVNKYGPEGAARAWIGGEKGMNNLGARDVLGTSIGQYASNFAKELSGGEPSEKGVATAFAPEGGGSTELSAQTRQSSPPPVNAGGTSPGVDWGANNKLWPALTAAGFSMMASRSPFPSVAVGEGGLAGMQQYGAERQREMQQSRINLEAQRLQRNLDIAERNLAIRELPYKGVLTAKDTKQLAIDAAKLKESQRQHNLALRKPVQYGTDPVTGDPRYALPRPTEDGAVDYYPIDPKTGKVSPSPLGKSLNNPALGQPQEGFGQPPGAQNAGGFQLVSDERQQAIEAAPPMEVRAALPPGSKQARNEAYLEYLRKENPRYAELIKGIASYQTSPNQFSLRNNRRERAMGDVLMYDPTYDQRRYNQTNRNITGWAQSPEGRAMRSLSVTVEHLGTAEELGKALQNGDTQVLNKVKNWAKAQLGYEGPVNFEFAKQIVGDEIVKAVIGSQSTGGERENLQRQLSAANSPEQLAGVIRTAKELMAGQLVGLKHVYETSTGLHNFDDWLTPRARHEVGDLIEEQERKLRARGAAGAPGAHTPAASAAAPPKTVERRVQNGYVYEKQPDGNWKAVGKAP